MTKEDFYNTIIDLNLRVVHLANSLPDNNTGKFIAERLLAASEGLAAGYRYALKSSTKLVFINRLEKPERSAEEILYWAEIIRKSVIISEEELSRALNAVRRITDLIKETRNFSQRNNEYLLNKIIKSE